MPALPAPFRSAATLAAVVVAVGLATPAPAAVARPSASTCVTTGSGAQDSGAAALRALGPNLAAAAVLNRLSAATLRTLLSTDPTTRIDRCGRVFFQEPAAPAGPAPAASALPSAAPGLVASGDAFSLQSRPGSQHTIYIDVHGMALTGTLWNSKYSLPAGYFMAPWSLDAETTTFSATERNAIREIWLRVAEDYAPFDVNVTTKDLGEAAIDRSGPSDQVYGTRALLTNDMLVARLCSCGGYAYVGIFDASYEHSVYQPALVLAGEFGNQIANIAEVTSHEVGHNLGLWHDGTTAGVEYYEGSGAWGPIMGDSYNRPISQWSKGEYPAANRSGQDDIATIASFTGLVPDEPGTGSSTARTLRTGVGLGGIISGAADSDWYAVSSTGGALSVSVATQAVGTDLDARLVVYRSDGTPLATADPKTPLVATSGSSTTGMSAAWSGAVAAGTYYVRVSGTGNGDPLTTGYTAYGSIGRYTVTAVTPQASALAVFTTSAGEAVRSLTYRAPMVAVGVDGPTTWSVASGALPVGIALDPATGVLSGTSSTVGRSSFTLRVADGTGHTAVRAFGLAVVAPVVMGSTTWAVGTLGRKYTARSAASGGSGSYVWTRVAGVLPPGLALTRTGVLTGTPRARGSFRMTVQVADYSGAAALAGRSARRSILVRVVKPVTVVSARLATAVHGRAYVAKLVAAGGAGTYTWSSRSLPRGLSLSATGRITGRAARRGSYRLVLLVRDAAGRRAGRTLVLVVR